MFQNPYMYNLNGNGEGQFLASYPEGTLLGGNSNMNFSRPRPMYNVRPQHNLPTYGLDMNAMSYESNNSNSGNPYKKANKIIREIINFNEEKANNIIIIVI